MPKIYSAQKTLAFCRFAAPGIYLLRKVFRPISAVLVRSTTFLNKHFTRKNHNISVDELSQALELTDKAELSEENNILEGIIRFGGETAKEVMTSRLDVVDLDIRTSFKDVMKCIVDNAYSRIPIYSGSRDNIKGVLYIKDLLPHVNHTWVFEAKTQLSDFYKITKLDEDDFERVSGDADTLAGLLLEIKGEFPVLHEKVSYLNYEFEVLEMDNRRILKVKFIINQPQTEEDA